VLQKGKGRGRKRKNRRSKLKEKIEDIEEEHRRNRRRKIENIEGEIRKKIFFSSFSSASFFAEKTKLCRSIKLRNYSNLKMDYFQLFHRLIVFPVEYRVTCSYSNLPLF
jgi:hypothetical protein